MIVKGILALILIYLIYRSKPLKMKNLFTLIILGLLLCDVSLAQVNHPAKVFDNLIMERDLNTFNIGGERIFDIHKNNKKVSVFYMPL